MHTEKKQVVIVGAGASGLSAAHALRERGVRDVVVVEQGPAPGGKCSTLEYEGRTYELGAAIVTPSYRHVRRLMAEYNVPWKFRSSGAFMGAADGHVSRRPFVPPGVGPLGMLRLASELRRVFVNELAAQRARFPRLDAAPSALSDSFAKWALSNDYQELLAMVRPWATGFGYGFMEDVPAAYILNYLCVFAPAFELHETGYGGLWQRVAETLDVRVNAGVERIERGLSGVRVSTARGVIEADKLILTGPLDRSLEYLDASGEERDSFGRIRTMDYQTIALDTRGMPPQAYVFLPDNMGKDALGKPMFYYRRYADSGVITLYSFRGPGGLDGAEEEAIRMVQRAGGQVRKVLARRAWHYFPHVGSQDFAAGFYEKLQAMQGSQNTYYAGELLSFSCVEPVVAYATQLASRVADDRLRAMPREVRGLSSAVVENDTQVSARAVNE